MLSYVFLRYVASTPLDAKTKTTVNNSIAAIILCVILPVAVIAQGIAYDKETLDLFAPYPKSEALDHIAHYARLSRRPDPAALSALFHLVSRWRSARCNGDSYQC